MAMNKREKAELEAWKTRAALRWTEAVAPDVQPPSSVSHGVSVGFLPIAAGSGSDRVEHACSGLSSHGTSSKPTTRTTSQQPRALYSTRLLALCALRHQAEQKYAEALRRIDRLIEQEHDDAA